MTSTSKFADNYQNSLASGSSDECQIVAKFILVQK